MPFDLLHDELRLRSMFDVDEIAKNVTTRHPDDPAGVDCTHPIDHVFVQGRYDVANINACIPSNDVTDHPYVLVTLERND